MFCGRLSTEGKDKYLVRAGLAREGRDTSVTGRGKSVGTESTHRSFSD